MRFVERVARLPHLGVGISTEFGAAAHGIHPVYLREQHPQIIDFLEIGADLERGIDDATRAWVARGWPTTWHFLDVNLEQPEDLDDAWVRGTTEAALSVGAAWLCGDAGLWHIGPRDRGHGTLLPPIFCGASAREMADAVVSLRERTGLEVLPENPPAHVLVGDLHPLAYYGQVAELSDGGLLLDLSHLAIAQQALGLAPTALLDEFPIERVVELHVAGGRRFVSGRRTFIDDDHGPEVVDEVWALLEAVLSRASALRAVVVECERNTIEEVLPLFRRVRAAVTASRCESSAPPTLFGPPDEIPVDHRSLQRTLFQMLLDPAFARSLPPGTHPWLTKLDPDALSADPGGRRAGQLLGNVALEFVHTVATAPPFLEGFPSSSEFREAIACDGALPLAFARYAARILPTGPWRALLSLEAAMAELRRKPTTRESATAGVVRVASTVSMLELPSGTLAAADALAQGLPPTPIHKGIERVILCTSGDPSPTRDIRVELLPDAVAELVWSFPAGLAELEAFAIRHDADLDDVLALVEDLTRDGVLLPLSG